MSYKVIMAESAEREFQKWKLPPDLFIEVINKLHVDLASNPDLYLKERVVPLCTYVFNFILIIKHPFPHRRAFTFFVDRDDAELELHVVGCRYEHASMEDD